MKIKINSGNEALFSALEGVDKVYDIIAPFIGPNKKNIIYHKQTYRSDELYSSIKKITEGVDLFEEALTTDPVEQVAIDHIKNAVFKTNAISGDKSSTTAMLLCSIYKEAMKVVALGYRIDKVISGIIKSKAIAEKYLEEEKIPFSIENGNHMIDRLVCNNTKYSGVLRSVMKKTDIDSFISIKINVGEGNLPLTLEKDEGVEFEFDTVLASSANFNLCAEDVYIVGVSYHLLDKKEFISDYLLLLAKYQKLIIIIQVSDSNRINNKVINSLSKNLIKNKILYAILLKTDEYSGPQDEFIDFLSYLGSSLLDGLTDFKEINIGKADKLSITNTAIKAINSSIDESVTASRIEVISSEISNKREENLENKYKYGNRYDNEYEEKDEFFDEKRRIAKLKNNHYIIQGSELSLKDCLDEYKFLKKSIFIINRSRTSGFIKDSNLAYLSISEAITREKIEDEQELYGAQAVSHSLEKPLYWICKNSNKEPTLLIKEIHKSDFKIGFDALTNKSFNVNDSNALDPFEPTIVALNSAIDGAIDLLESSSIITCQNFINQDEDDLMKF